LEIAPQTYLPDVPGLVDGNYHNFFDDDISRFDSAQDALEW
jgi:hypothetical protein